MSLLAARTPFSSPKDPSDLVITIEAEDRHNFKDRLAEITAPTLVVAGDKDPFYSADLFRETAEGIPNARLILYPGMGHPASGPQFHRDLRAFLKEDTAERS
jgi:pimeloyl-ACP methyl ester carboxylesterase